MSVRRTVTGRGEVDLFASVDIGGGKVFLPEFLNK